MIFQSSLLFMTVFTTLSRGVCCTAISIPGLASALPAGFESLVVGFVARRNTVMSASARRFFLAVAAFHVPDGTDKIFDDVTAMDGIFGLCRAASVDTGFFSGICQGKAPTNFDRNTRCKKAGPFCEQSTRADLVTLRHSCPKLGKTPEDGWQIQQCASSSSISLQTFPILDTD